MFFQWKGITGFYYIHSSNWKKIVTIIVQKMLCDHKILKYKEIKESDKFCFLPQKTYKELQNVDF